MTTEIGRGVITVTMDRSGFDRSLRSLEGNSKSRFAAVGKVAKTGLLAAAAGVGLLTKQAVTLEANYSRTMNKVQAATGATNRQMDSLGKLAIKMGRDTVFSAAESADAMLELAKGGMKPATIQAGALRASLQLAAAGGLEMGDAANTMVRAMGAFGLKGKQAGQVANALAGAANASSADVGELSMALGQAGLAANASGLNIQETTGILAAFANQGLRGSDAGTSLKTMLTSLQPQTAKASEAFRELGLMTEDGRSKFVKANGEFKSAVQIAKLLEQGTRKLTDAEKQRNLRLAFGSDAFRAALALSNEGEKGLRRYIGATRDQTAAQRMANAGMKGTAGAIEQLKGSFETVMLQVGLAIQPAVVKGLNFLTGALNALGGVIERLGSGGRGLGRFGQELAATGAALASFGRAVLPPIIDFGRQMTKVVGPALASLGRLVVTELLPAFRGILPVVAPVARFLIGVLGDAVIGALKGAIQFLKGAVNIIAGVFRLLKAVITGEWGDAWRAVKQIARGVWDAIVGAFKVWWNLGILALFKKGALALVKGWKGLWANVKSLGSKGLALVEKVIVGSLKFIGGVFVKAVKGYLGFWKGLLKALWQVTVNGWKVLRSAFGGAFAALRTMFSDTVKRVVGFWRNLWDSMKAWGGRMVDLVKKTIPAAFRAGRDAIGRIWNGLKALARKPVEFIVNTVYMKGIYRVIDALPGGNPLPRLSFADGGVLPGHTPGRDVHRFYSPTGGRLDLSGGEAILRPEFTRMVGVRTVDFLNEAARRGTAALSKALQTLSGRRQHGPHARFARGGVNPLPGGRVTNNHGRGYYGASFAADYNKPGNDYGAPVVAWRAGRVAATNFWTSSYGKHVNVNHGGSWSRYAHLSAILVRVGQMLRAGQILGRVGSTGNSTGPHLHFEIHGGGTAPTAGGAVRDVVAAMFAKAQALAGSLRNKAGGWADRLKGMGPWGSMFTGAMRHMVDRAVDYVKDKLGSFGNSMIGKGMAGAGPQGYARELLQRMGWSYAHWPALHNLWQRESGWRWNARNPSSGAYGIPQALPGSKMASAGRDWRTNPRTQIRWGLNYIRARYGSPGAAWAHFQRRGWYDRGGLAVGSGMLPKLTPRPERVLDPRQTAAWERASHVLTAPRFVATLEAIESGGRGAGGAATVVQFTGPVTTTDVDRLAERVALLERRALAVARL